MYRYVEAPTPHCNKCDQDHVPIPWAGNRFVYRCDGCWAYGGPLFIRETSINFDRYGLIFTSDFTRYSEKQGTNLATKTRGVHTIDHTYPAPGPGTDLVETAASGKLNMQELHEIGIFPKSVNNKDVTTRTNIGQNKPRKKQEKAKRRMKSRRPVKTNSKRLRHLERLENYV